ncbi:MAG: SDH family Clp fold serine proteinase [Xanthobacteraceae bacterium]
MAGEARSEGAPEKTGREKRKELIGKIEASREGRLLIAYITSTRPGLEIQLGDDSLPFIHTALEGAKQKAKKGVDLFIHSNGGSGTTPWRLVNLIREYTKDFTVLVPHHAFSAATLIALGADKIIMHKMGCLGPIDPSVTNAFNPPHPHNPGQLIPISVEDVTAYFTLIKEDIGVQHEDELVQAIIALTEKIHPLALGNVQRSHHQSRMIARKLLQKHIPKAQQHEIDKLVENLKSNLYFHGHPINREEAKTDLGLKAERASEELEQLMWSLYEEYSQELKITERFNPLHEWEIQQPAPAQAPQPPTTQQIVTQIVQLAQAGIGMPAVQPQELVNLAAAMIPHLTPAPGGATNRKARINGAKCAYSESADNAHVFLADLTLERVTATTPTGPSDLMKQEVARQRWEQVP